MGPLIRYLKNNVWAAVALTVGALMNLYGFASDIWNWWTLGLPSAVYQLVGALIFFVSVVVMLYRASPEYAEATGRARAPAQPRGDNSRQRLAARIAALAEAARNRGQGRDAGMMFAMLRRDIEQSIHPVWVNAEIAQLRRDFMAQVGVVAQDGADEAALARLDDLRNRLAERILEFNG